jgi:hypothetical protein
MRKDTGGPPKHAILPPETRQKPPFDRQKTAVQRQRSAAANPTAATVSTVIYGEIRRASGGVKTDELGISDWG